LDIQKELLEEISTLAASAYNYVKKLEKVVAETVEIKDVTMQGTSYRDQVIPVMEELRRDIDRLETIVDSKYWPMPTYGDLLFGIQ
jgi:glutamine synthetase